VGVPPGRDAEVAFSRALVTSAREWVEACRRLRDTPVRHVQVTDMAGVDAFVDATVAALTLPEAAVSLSVALPVRSALQTAYAAAELAGVASSSPTVFFGPGSRRVLHDQHGLEWRPPVANLRDYAASVRELLRAPLGTAVVTGGLHPARGPGLGVPPERLQLGVGGHGRRVLGLAPDIGPALAVHIFTRRDTIAARVREAFPDETKPRVEVGVMTSVHPDEGEALRLGSLELASFLFTLGPGHPRLVESLGEERAEEVGRLFPEGVPTVAAALTESEVRSMVLVATPGTYRDSLRAYAPADVLLPVAVGMLGGPGVFGVLTAAETDAVRTHLYDSFFDERTST
jgi:hypothetical protein